MIFAGVDNLSLDKRKFDPSRDDIEDVCRFFSIGKLRHYEKEKGIIVSHANFFVFVETTQGQYALKFYTADAAKIIAIEYAINRVLIDRHFPTPVMHAGVGGRAHFPSNDLLAACFSYIDGRPAWAHIKGPNAIHQINTAMLSLKKILSSPMKRIPFLKEESLAITTKAIARDSRALAPYDQKEMIDASLLDACRTYQSHKPLFTRQWLHNNANLNNFLVYQKTVYTLDLSHIREDYTLSDLASLVISCLFFDVPPAAIKTIASDYFLQHKMGKEHYLVLNTLVRIGLIKEYLKNIRREKSIGLSKYPPDLVQSYLSNLTKRKRSITAALRRLIDQTTDLGTQVQK